MQDLQYDERLKQLGLMQLERQRERSDLIETFNIMNGVYDINGDLFFKLDEGGRRGHDQKLFKKRFRINIRKFAFGNRVINNCVHCKTINIFKKHLSPALELGVV